MSLSQPRNPLILTASPCAPTPCATFLRQGAALASDGASGLARVVAGRVGGCTHLSE
jgi:hypothetical protein